MVVVYDLQYGFCYGMVPHLLLQYVDEFQLLHIIQYAGLVLGEYTTLQHPQLQGYDQRLQSLLQVLWVRLAKILIKIIQSHIDVLEDEFQLLAVDAELQLNNILQQLVADIRITRNILQQKCVEWEIQCSHRHNRQRNHRLRLRCWFLVVREQTS